MSKRNKVTKKKQFLFIDSSIRIISFLLGMITSTHREISKTMYGNKITIFLLLISIGPRNYKSFYLNNMHYFDRQRIGFMPVLDQIVEPEVELVAEKSEKVNSNIKS